MQQTHALSEPMIADTPLGDIEGALGHIDGIDLSPALRGSAPSPRQVLFYYWDSELRAVRKGRYKAHFITSGAYGEGEPRQAQTPPLLFDLSIDPGERTKSADSQSAMTPKDMSTACSRCRQDPNRLKPRTRLFVQPTVMARSGTFRRCWMRCPASGRTSTTRFTE